jgi:hypothetical protein
LQADIQLLQYPFAFTFPADVSANDVALYDKAIGIGGPMMTRGAFAGARNGSSFPPQLSC